MNHHKKSLVLGAIALSALLLTSCTGNGSGDAEISEAASLQIANTLTPTDILGVPAFSDIPEVWKYQEGQKMNPTDKKGACKVSSMVVDNPYAGLGQGDTFSTHLAFTNFVANDKNMSSVAMGKLQIPKTQIGAMEFITYEYSSDRTVRSINTKTDEITSKQEKMNSLVAVRGFDTPNKPKEGEVGRTSQAILLIGGCPDNVDFDRDKIKSIMESAEVIYIPKDNDE